MRFNSMLPPSLRVIPNATLRLIGDLRDATLPRREIARSRHTDAELQAIRDAAAAHRADGRHRAALILKVVAVRRETRNAVVLDFEAADGAAVAFRAGQFFTLRADIDGREIRRSYSVCSDPASGRLAVCVKRVSGGLMSNWLNDNAAPGMLLSADGPQGRFGAELRADDERELILIAGGSGITPLLSMLKTALGQGRRDVHLIYANRGVRSVIFKGELDELAARHSRLRVTHVIERPSKRWSGRVGRLTSESLRELLPGSADRDMYVCGPEGMMESVRLHGERSGWEPSSLHFEHFVDQSSTVTERTPGVELQPRRVVMRASGRSFDVQPGETLLEAGLRAGAPMQFSCTMGGCASCRVSVKSGTFHMPEPHCLTGEEMAAGDCLACIAQPLSDLELNC